jgi:hypothetical protein
MKKLLLIVLIGILFPLIALSQVHNVYIGNGSSSLYLSSTPDPHGVGFNDRYLNTEWKNGSVITNQNMLLNNVGLRFNITKGQFEVVSSLNPKVVKRINLNGDVFVYTGYVDKNGEVKETYFQLLSEGNTRLLMRRSVLRKQGKKGLYGYDPYETVRETYYIQKGNKPAVQVKRSKKSILSVLSDEEKPLESWLHNNDISFYKISDVGKLLKYYDSLKAKRPATE